MRFYYRAYADADFAAGRRALAKHDPARALPLFRKALESASPQQPALYADRIYWLSVTLIKLGKEGLAIKALAGALPVVPRGRVRKLYCRVSNEYGMPRSSCPEHDDYRAFLSIQLRRYLGSVPGGRFADQTEIDAVLKIIADAWLRLKRSGQLESMVCAEKLASFKAFSLRFPVLRANGIQASSVLPGDFRPASRADSGGRCPCGSGLPAQRCCARVQQPFEF